jgi:hypothetical protein
MTMRHCETTEPTAGHSSMPCGRESLIAGFDVVVKNMAGGDGHTDTVIKVRLKDQARFVELAMKHLGLLTERVELSGSLGLVARLQEARKLCAAS